MSYTLNIYGHDAPSEDIKAAAREAFAKMAEAGATNGSLSGSGNDGPSVSITFPEPASETVADAEAESGSEA